MTEEKSIDQIRRANLRLIFDCAKQVHGVDRITISRLVNLGISHINQHLTPRPKKDLSKITLQKFCDYFGMSLAWFDHEKHELEVVAAIRRSLTASGYVAKDQNPEVNLTVKSYNVAPSSIRIVLVTKTIQMIRGTELKILNNDEITHKVSLPLNAQQPLAMVIDGSGYAKPYNDGNVLILDAGISPSSLDDVLVQAKNGKVYMGEYKGELNNKLHLNDFDQHADISINLEEVESVMVIIGVVYRTAVSKI